MFHLECAALEKHQSLPMCTFDLFNAASYVNLAACLAIELDNIQYVLALLSLNHQGGFIPVTFSSLTHL